MYLARGVPWTHFGDGRWGLRCYLIQLDFSGIMGQQSRSPHSSRGVSL